MKTQMKLWIGIGVLIILCPLGLIIPDYFHAGDAWGEWDAEELKKLTGYVPKGLEKLAKIWNAPMPDYGIKGWENKGLSHLSVGYIVSAIVGITVISLAVSFIGKRLTRKNEQK
jgi:hypothetical protein